MQRLRCAPDLRSGFRAAHRLMGDDRDVRFRPSAEVLAKFPNFPFPPRTNRDECPLPRNTGERDTALLAVCVLGRLRQAALARHAIAQQTIREQCLEVEPERTEHCFDIATAEVVKSYRDVSRHLRRCFCTAAVPAARRRSSSAAGRRFGNSGSSKVNGPRTGGACARANFISASDRIVMYSLSREEESNQSLSAVTTSAAASLAAAPAAAAATERCSWVIWRTISSRRAKVSRAFL